MRLKLTRSKNVYFLNINLYQQKQSSGLYWLFLLGTYRYIRQDFQITGILW